MSENPPAGQPPPPLPETPRKRGWFTRFLDAVEWLGNLLPHPVTLFAIFALGVVLLSGIGGFFNWSVTIEPPEGVDTRMPAQEIHVNSLMNGDGLRWIVENLVSNFVGFTPLGTVLVALLGVGVAEKSGLLSAFIRWIVLGAPKNLITMAVVFAGVLSNTASEMGYVVLIPLAAAMFHSLGRHPFAGLAAAFAGVSGGYSANLLIGTVDPLLAGITEEAAQLIDPDYEVHAAVNWYFMIASTFLVTIIGTLVTSLIVEPKLGGYDDSEADKTINEEITMEPLSRKEKKAMGKAGLAALAMIVLFIYLAGPHYTDDYELPPGTTLAEARGWDQAQLDAAVQEAEAIREATRQAAKEAQSQENANAIDPELNGEDADDTDEQDADTASSDFAELVVPVKDGWKGRVNERLLAIPGYGVLRDAETGGLLRSPFLRGVVALIFIFFLVPGFVYGYCTGVMKNDRDVIDAMAAAMSKMGLYIVLVFFAAQFVAFFGHTNLGSILAVLGADGIRAMGLDNPLVFIPFILMCCFVNLMLGSASAQWAVTAPIFVPMLMLTGYSPEVIQAAYRIGDSTTNIITPMMSYFGIIFAFAARYDNRLGIGTLISIMLPYTIFMLTFWVILFYIWVFAFGFPVGPEAPTYYPV